MTSLAKDGGGIFMSVVNQRDYDIVSRVLAAEITIKEAAVLLVKSYRQARRIVKSVKKKGMLGIKHGNLGKVPVNKIEEEKKKKVLDLLGGKYPDFNLTHFSEKLVSEHGISVKRETLRKWAHEKHLVKKAHCRKGRKIHRSRPRMPQRGMLLQLDGSPEKWLGPGTQVLSLIGNIDDATSTCEYAELFLSEDSISVLSVLKNTVERVGIPEVLYVDRAGWAGGLNKPRIDWEKHLTHVQRAMAELGCRVLHAPSPQAKGRIERMWGTFQDRLIPELRIRKIKRIGSANYFIKNHFVPDFNRRFSVAPRNAEISYRKVPRHIDLNEVFCLKEWRRVTSGESISYENEIFIVKHNYQYSLNKLYIEIRTYLDGKQKYFHANKPVELEPHKRQQRCA